jgi:PHD/YefM family antitoxin component YafN of YafNO toxin-antitoxin module
MKTITIEQASRDVSSIINYALKTHDEVNIATELGSVIMLAQEDYESMQETLRLLMDKKSLKALLQGHSIRDKGLTPNSYCVEDVFSDL